MSIFHLTKDALEKLLGGEVNFMRPDSFKSLSPLPDIEGTLLFNSIIFSIDENFKTSCIELVYDGLTVATMDVAGISSGGKVTLVLQEGIMRIDLM